MTTKGDFTDEEWVRVRLAPFVAGLAISMADPGGPIELAKESMGTVKSATNPPTREQLLSEVALDIQSMTQQRQNPLSDFKPQAPEHKGHGGGGSCIQAMASYGCAGRCGRR